VQYDTIKIRRPTRQQLDELKTSMGYPSYSQIISALVERQKAKDETIEQLRKELGEEAGKIFARMFYELLFSLATETNKPIPQITLTDLFQVIQKKDHKEIISSKP
jgi:predicted CopG family antitoxin